jgi:hypothetical protein
VLAPVDRTLIVYESGSCVRTLTRLDLMQEALQRLRQLLQLRLHPLLLIGCPPQYARRPGVPMYLHHSLHRGAWLAHIVMQE